MTIKELIAKLKQFDPELVVLFEVEEYTCKVGGLTVQQRLDMDDRGPLSRRPSFNYMILHEGCG